MPEGIKIDVPEGQEPPNDQNINDYIISAYVSGIDDAITQLQALRAQFIQAIQEAKEKAAAAAAAVEEDEEVVG